MYSTEQKKLVKHIKTRVKNLFEEHPVKAHNFDHAERVRRWAVIIAKAEKVNIFLSELSALLHDIGRVSEHMLGNTKSHHELSYEWCQQWFREDREFDVLSKEEKLTILYALRYHWNDVADKYTVAWVLRDADKIDGFGKIGLNRTIECFGEDPKKLELDLRLRYHCLFELHTKTARKIVEKKKFFEPIHNYYNRFLKSKIKPVEL